MKNAILAIALAAICGSTIAAPKAKKAAPVPVEIDIKGIKLGMTKEEVKTLHPQGTSWADAKFTIAGVASKYEHASLESYDKEGRVERMSWFFENDGFETLLIAFKKKYPGLKCEFSVVSNRMGAKFEKADCYYGDLHLSNILDDIDTGVVSVSRSEDAVKAYDAKQKKAASDV